MIILAKYKFSAIILFLTFIFAPQGQANPAKGDTLSGTASWYGIYFQGRPTASGEPYDRHELTAAHKTLPLQTKVKVTNLINNKTVIVRINDRGPFVGERIIDLSEAAAKKIGYLHKGVTEVIVEIIGLPEDKKTRLAAARAKQKAALAKAAAAIKKKIYAFVRPEVSRKAARAYLVRQPEPYYPLQPLPATATNYPHVDQEKVFMHLLPKTLLEQDSDSDQAVLQSDSGWYTASSEAVRFRKKTFKKGYTA